MTEQNVPRRSSRSYWAIVAVQARTRSPSASMILRRIAARRWPLQGLADLRADPLVAEEQRHRLEQFFPLQQPWPRVAWRNAAMISSVSNSSIGRGRLAGSSSSGSLPVSRLSSFDSSSGLVLRHPHRRLRRSVATFVGCGLFSASPLVGPWLALLLVQPLLDFLGVSLVVQLQQAGEDFTAGRFADRVADALLRLVEAVAEVEVGPAVGGGDGVVHLDVKLTEFLDVGALSSGLWKRL